MPGATSAFLMLLGLSLASFKHLSSQKQCSSVTVGGHVRALLADFAAEVVSTPKLDRESAPSPFDSPAIACGTPACSELFV